ncbi:MAG: RHS repeat-associated core domain-containing protein [Pedobacter sp.]
MKKLSGIIKSAVLAAFLATALPLPVSSAWAETYTKSFTYDLNGNIATRTTPDNATISYTYDGVNRLTDITYPDTKKVSYVYDANGNRTSMTDPNGTTYYAYDQFNRLIAVQPPGIVPIYYDYDKSGNLTKLTYPDGTVVSYIYDTSNRLWKVTDPNGTTTYDYDNNSNHVTRKTLPNGVYTSYTYDTAKRITDVINKKSDNSVISSHHYVFDANGNRTQSVDTTSAGAKTTNYTYDKLNRLTNATCSDGAYETYTYDSSGNRLTKTTQSGTLTYDYDQDNRLIKIGSATGNTALFYDRSGNLTKKISSSKTITYGYDYENRLISYADGTNTITFGYDGDGNRVSKTVFGVTQKYINDTSSPIPQVLLETNEINNVTARYTYGDSRLSQMNHGVTSYYVYDNPGRSVVAVVNGSQAVLNSYAYNAFGDIKTSNETTPNDFLYNGERVDDETGLVYLRKRYYDLETGRFLSKDMFSGFVAQPQSENPYPYAQNNPVNWIDPLGLEKTCVCQVTFSAVGPKQAVGYGALGIKPPNDSVAIGPASFGLPYTTIAERNATQNEIRANIDNIQISAPGLSQYLTGGTTFTIGDIGDRNIRNSPTTRFDIYRFETQKDALDFGKQSVQVTITGVPDKWSCPK